MVVIIILKSFTTMVSGGEPVIDKDFEAAIEPFISIIRNPDLPFRAKLAAATTIEAILTENPMKSVRILAQEDFLQPLGKILGITVLNPYSSNNTETILGILSRICSFSKGAKALVQTYCFQALNTVSKQYSIVKKANEILN